MKNDGSANETVTMALQAIHNPSEPRHFMRVKPVSAKVKISHGNTLLAETSNAVRVLEVGRDFYDPVFYLPRDAAIVDLAEIRGKRTHCPLKGDAIYFTLVNADIDVDDYLAWSYDDPFEFSLVLKGLIAFNPKGLKIEEIRE